MRSGKFLLGLASTAILGSESRTTHNHISLSHGSGSRGTFLQWRNRGSIPECFLEGLKKPTKTSVSLAEIVTRHMLDTGLPLHQPIHCQDVTWQLISDA
jgi:hypothetical protein